MEKYSLQGVAIISTVSATFASILAYVEKMTEPLLVLLIVVIIDYITGMIKGWKNKELNSRQGIWGIIKKICYFLIVIAAMGVDWVVQYGAYHFNIQIQFTGAITLLVIIWLIINELISILENLIDIIGIPTPGILADLLSHLKKSTEEKGILQGNENESEGNK